jgi:hypothetical protein
VTRDFEGVVHDIKWGPSKSLVRHNGTVPAPCSVLWLGTINNLGRPGGPGPGASRGKNSNCKILSPIRLGRSCSWIHTAIVRYEETVSCIDEGSVNSYNLYEGGFGNIYENNKFKNSSIQQVLF